MSDHASPESLRAAPPRDENRLQPERDPRAVLDALGGARERTLALVEGLDDADLVRVHSPIMSPLVWDLGHIAAYEDLWLAHRMAGMELLRGDLAELYDAFETPRAVRGQIPTLSPAEAHEYLAAVRGRVTAQIERDGVGDGVLCEMVMRHELQHTETMRQTMAIAGLLPAGEPPAQPMVEPEGWRELPAATFAMGAEDGSFSYDNERPRHEVDVGAVSIARRPVSNASWLRFSEGGGYERREWWSAEGWAWKQEHDITHHPGVAAGHPQAPACHVSFFEAEAFARAHAARLPSEAEWEHAARAGALAATGAVWEWTDSHFDGYPGFVAHPYREYSEVFFGEGYRVLRGSSWATAPRLANITFRNWDLPQRRQIFAGVRLARNAA